MTREQAISECQTLSQKSLLWGFVYTCRALGFNFRFIEPIESVDPAYGKTVAMISPSGHVIPVA